MGCTIMSGTQKVSDIDGKSTFWPTWHDMCGKHGFAFHSDKLLSDTQ